MPTLINRRHEWFAGLRAEGLSLEDAYERAGYAPDRGHACRLAARPDVAQRINEMRAYFTDVVTAERRDVIAALMDLARTCREYGTTAGLKEARIAYLAAADIQNQITLERARDRELIARSLDGLPARERRRGLPRAVEAAGDPGPAPVFEDDYPADDDQDALGQGFRYEAGDDAR